MFGSDWLFINMGWAFPASLYQSFLYIRVNYEAGHGQPSLEYWEKRTLNRFDAPD
jgi:hypothetical protein